MCPDRDEFSKLNSLKDPIIITIADGSEVEAQGVGKVRVQLNTGEVIRVEETIWCQAWTEGYFQYRHYQEKDFK